MQKQQRLEYQKSVEEYLSKNLIHEKFQKLMQNLVINKPEDPIQAMIDQLSKFDRKILFFVGPPNSMFQELSDQVSTKFDYHILSLDKLIEKEKQKDSDRAKKLKEQLEQQYFINDEIINEIFFEAYTEFQNNQELNQNHLLISGYPNTRIQGQFLQRKGILPDQFIILKQDVEQCRELTNYNFNITQVQEVYKNFYYSLDATLPNPYQTLERLLKFKIQQKGPKQTTKILIIGPPGSGRSLLCKNLSKRLNLVSISTQQLLQNQISNKTKVGVIAQNFIQQGQLVPNDIIIGLVYNRISKTDTAMQGYIIDGFPKNFEQFQQLESIKLNPTIVIILECQKDTIISRIRARKLDPHTGIFYDNLNQCKDETIRKRLVQQENETQQILEQRIDRSKNLQDQITQYYDEKNLSDLYLRIDASLDYNNIAELAQTHLENLA